MKEIKHGHFSSVEETLPYLNEVRKQYFSHIILYLSFAFLLVLISFSLFVLGFVIDSGRFFILFVIASLLLLFLVPIIFYLKAKKLNRQYKFVVYGNLLLFYTLNHYDNFAFLYQIDQERLIQNCKRKDFIPREDEPISHYKGNIKKVTFMSFAYINAKQKKRLFPSYPLSYGRMIVFTRPVFSPCSFVILANQNKNDFILSETLKPYELDNDAFGSQYCVFSVEGANVESILTKDLKEGILRLNKEFGCTLSLFIEDNKWSIYLDNLKESFLLKMNKELVLSSCSFIQDKFMLPRIIYDELGFDLQSEA